MHWTYLADGFKDTINGKSFTDRPVAGHLPDDKGDLFLPG
jgi:hypothetical protein